MPAPSYKAQTRLAIFFIVGVFLFIGAVVTLVGTKIWNPKDRYFVRYKESVSGLDVGSSVKMHGVRVGQVEYIRVEDAETVLAGLALDPGTPVKADTVATTESMGITGLMFVELGGGSRASKAISPNGPSSEIRAGITHSLTGRAIDVSRKAEQVLNNLLPLTGENNRAKLSRVLDSADQLARTINDVLANDKINHILENIDTMTTASARAARHLNSFIVRGTPELITALSATSHAAKSLDRALVNIHPQTAFDEIATTSRAIRTRVNDPAIAQTLAGLRSATQNVQNISADIRSAVKRNDRSLAQIWSHLRDATSDLKAFARAIKERPALLLRGDTLKERSFR